MELGKRIGNVELFVFWVIVKNKQKVLATGKRHAPPDCIATVGMQEQSGGFRVEGVKIKEG